MSNATRRCPENPVAKRRRAGYEVALNYNGSPLRCCRAPRRNQGQGQISTALRQRSRISRHPCRKLVVSMASLALTDKGQRELELLVD